MQDHTSLKKPGPVDTKWQQNWDWAPCIRLKLHAAKNMSALTSVVTVLAEGLLQRTRVAHICWKNWCNKLDPEGVPWCRQGQCLYPSLILQKDAKLREIQSLTSNQSQNQYSISTSLRTSSDVLCSSPCFSIGTDLDLRLPSTRFQRQCFQLPHMDP